MCILFPEAWFIEHLQVLDAPMIVLNFLFDNEERVGLGKKMREMNEWPIFLTQLYLHLTYHELYFDR